MPLIAFVRTQKTYFPCFFAIAVLVFSNLLVSLLVDLGDAEALYYAYSRHLSFSYLDHPPLIGWLIRLSTSVFGQTVIGVRVVSMTTIALSLYFSTRLTHDIFGEDSARLVPLLMAATPVFSIGLTAATPDAPLCALWPLITHQLYLGLIVDPRSPDRWTARLRPIFVGLLLGLAFLAKYTGGMLAISVLVLLVRKEHRSHLRRKTFWIGALLFLIMITPVLYWNAVHGWAGVLHRLVWTQNDAGCSIRNAGALIGGQFLYIGPLTLWLFVSALKRLTKLPSNTILVSAALPTLVMGYILVLWSKVAEPHWPAAGYLPLFPLAAHLVCRHAPFVRIARYSIYFGGAVLLIMHLLVLTPLFPLLMPQDSYEPQYDLANELRGWPLAAEVIREKTPKGGIVAAGFYTQCAQLQFALNRDSDPKVQCASASIDDFDIWYPKLPDAASILFVDDNRFKHDTTQLLPNHTLVQSWSTPIFRGGRRVREFSFRLAVPSSRHLDAQRP